MTFVCLFLSCYPVKGGNIIDRHTESQGLAVFIVLDILVIFGNVTRAVYFSKFNH